MSDRLSHGGRWIDRARPVRFQFENLPFQGYAGDTISSALWASGVRVLGRSFKYHRPRGVFSLANHDVNVLVESDERTNIRADVTPITEGMNLRAVNTSGGVFKDRLRFNEWLAKLMPVGFYYKAFHKPGWLFGIAERSMRKVAGLGSINVDAVAPATPKAYDFCDVLVIGAGASGLAAALAAAEGGLDVLLVDEHRAPGGSLLWRGDADGQARELIERVAATKNIRVQTGTTAAGYYTDHWVALVDNAKLTKLRARAVIAATGCAEQPAIFHNNDVPGVMLASAAQRLMHLYGVRPFARGVVLAGNSDGYRVALDLHEAGVDVAAIADLRPKGEPSDLAGRVESAGIPVQRGHAVYDVEPMTGKAGVAGVVLAALAENGQPDRGRQVHLACDGLAVSVGYAPAAALLYQAGVKFAYDDSVEQLTPRRLPPGVFAAGRVNGVFTLEDRRADGQRAGSAAAAFVTGQPANASSSPRHAGPAPSHPYPIIHHPKAKNFIDLDEDIHLADLVNAHQEGYDNIELLKRYTTVGMGASQGKLANMNAVRVLAKLNGASIDDTGTTTSRPFYHPVSMEVLAGRRFHPLRRTPMHALHEKLGARFVHVGAWLRPEYYEVGDQSREESILAEATNVRRNVGLVDVGTLGKIHVAGPDAAAFLERIYTGRFAKQKVGTTRYAVALDESAVVIDDGIVARLADDRFYVTATTSGADAMYREMQRWLILWDMTVTLVNATGRMAAVNLAGPRCREVLAALSEVDLSAPGFPYLGVRTGTVAGAEALLMRVGFVGELGYELHFAASAGRHVWQALMQAGERLGIRPFGVEAQRLLRLEKGHIIISQDTDAVTNPLEASLGFALGKDKPFYIGQRSLAIVREQTLERTLVGFTMAADHPGPWPQECHLIIEHGQIAGRVTSFARRTTVGQPIGLAFVRPDMAQPGRAFTIRVDGGHTVAAAVAPLPFYDAAAARQKM